MNKALLLLLAVSLNGAASEVDALNSQTQLETKALQVAIANTGVDARWTALPNDKMASKRETREFENRAEGISADLHEDLSIVISNKLDSLLSEIKY